MGAVWLRLRAELRARWRSWGGFALLVGLAAGAVMALAAGARRTDSAYSRFLGAHNAAHLLFSAVRRRRRDLAVLKTLGFVRRQVVGTVSVHATTVIVLGLLVGVPVGVAVGRWTWALMAENLGVLSRPQVPVLAVLALAVAALLLANAIAFVPGQLAARTRAATDLRAE